MLPIAHVAHWTSLLFFVPVLAFMVWLAVEQVRERRAARQGGGRSAGDG